MDHAAHRTDVILLLIVVIKNLHGYYMCCSCLW